MKSPLFLFTLIILASCSAPETKEAKENPDYPPVISDVWEAHGGLDRWNEFGMMQFTIGEGPTAETHYVNLANRKVLIESDSFRLGMDGEKVWVEPSLDALGRDARFYHNLIFYFAAIPFVFADPGVNIRDAGTRLLNGNEYRSVAISFKEGTGDADDDEYIMLINPQTNQVEWLLYTVTYFSGEKTDSYNALHYGDYRNVNGLMIVGKLSGYTYANDTTGAQRYANAFSNQSFAKEPMEDGRFEKPEEAEYWQE